MVIPTGLRWLTLRVRPDKSAWHHPSGRTGVRSDCRSDARFRGSIAMCGNFRVALDPEGLP